MKRFTGLIASAFFIAFSLLLLFYTPGESASQSKSPPGFAGDETCQGCHQEVFDNFERSSMGKALLRHPQNAPEGKLCETCHGPGEEHADSGGQSFGKMVRFTAKSTTSIKDRNAACLSCHEKRNLLFWQGSRHEMRDIGCTNCHTAHSGTTVHRKMLKKPSASEICADCHKQPAAQQLRFSHHPLREGKMDCSSCHNPHGTVGETLLKANSKPDLCLSCHTEFRGPFLNEHPPVREDCSNCHVSHGSNYPSLLKLPELRLCRECHIDIHNVNTPSRRNLNHAVGRLCTDCHLNIHGSNHPSGFYFTR